MDPNDMSPEEWWEANSEAHDRFMKASDEGIEALTAHPRDWDLIRSIRERRNAARADLDRLFPWVEATEKAILPSPARHTGLPESV